MRRLSAALFGLLLVKAPLLAQNVGIGTATPGDKLHIIGNTRLSNGYSLRGEISGSPYRLIGTGATFIAIGDFNAPSTTLFELPTSFGVNFQDGSGFSAMYVQQSNLSVGIGTVTPQDRLHVNGNSRISNGYSLRGEISGSPYRLIGTGGTFIAIGDYNAPSTTLFELPTSFGVNFQDASGFSAMYVQQSNLSVGIGTVTPQDRLHVNGNSRISNGYSLRGEIGGSPYRLIGTGGTFITIGDFNAPSSIIFELPTSYGVTFSNSGGSSAMYIQENPLYVGIGTVAPTAKLHVAGTFRLADGTQAAGRVLTSDASGNATWQILPTGGGTLDYAYDFGGAGAGRTITADAGAVLIQGTDGIWVTGTYGSGATIGSPGAGTRMLFNPRKAAFRAGYAWGAQWDDATVGDYSFAAGYGTTASGLVSVAIGESSTASGSNATALGRSVTASGSSSVAMGDVANATGFASIAIGYNTTGSGAYSSAFGIYTTASGSYSTALGERTTAESAYETALGRWNTDYVPINTGGWDVSDRLLVVGNGINSGARSDAMVILKNGQTGIGSSNPTYARLQVQGMVGNTVGYFSGSATSQGVALVSDWPGVYFNSYYNGGIKAMAGSGYPSIVNSDQSTGGMTFLTTDVANTTANGAVTLYERMRVTGAGNVGIGTSTPSERLHVYQSSFANKHVIYGYAAQSATGADYQNTGVTGFGTGANSTWGYGIGVKGIAYPASSWGSAGVYAGLGSGVPSYGNTSDFALYADAANLGYAGAFVNGYVGIGTTAPSYPLHVYAGSGRTVFIQSGNYWPNLAWFTNGNGNTADIWSWVGLVSTGYDAGVIGVSEGGTGDRLGGCFYVQNGASWPAVAAVGSVIDGTTYKIYGFGTVSTLVDDEDSDSLAVMAAPEAPEVLFQDFGTGQLQNGSARIELDPILSKNIRVDAAHPIKVFIQLEGDCNGVYVTEKSAQGFTVVELSGGQSNTSFSWMITANRADETRGGVTSRYSDMRFKKTTYPTAVALPTQPVPEEKTKE